MEDYGCVFVSGYDPTMDTQQLKRELEALAGVPCVLFTHKGVFSFFKFHGKN